jgi:hypothetical protein
MEPFVFGEADMKEVTITLKLDEAVLENRHCYCGSMEFRAVSFVPYKQAILCADCVYHANHVGCGRIINFRISDDGEILDCCGEIRDLGTGAIDSQSSIPLAICLKCNRLVELQ